LLVSLLVETMVGVEIAAVLQNLRLVVLLPQQLTQVLV
jgi:hypothetical protein